MFVAIIQARMGSTRLPNKVMAKVLNKPLIEYLLERVSKAKYIDKIILATTENSEDEILAKHVSSLGYEVFKGSENDVLGRYYNAFLTLGELKDSVEGIIRITGDCPLFEPEICDKLIEKYINYNLDFANLDKTFAEGLDCAVFSKDLLYEANANTKLPFEREHITQYFNENRKKFNVSSLVNETDDSHYRITVDEYDDLEVVKNIIEYFDKSDQEMNIENIKGYLDSFPEIFALNSNIIRNEGLIKSLNSENSKSQRGKCDI
ncbi:MAG: glycosyltransferase family protein [Gammaproteobacteria bacterium]|nr:glycosyltransferase family protein [Gammaproteobacteria bacterium]